MSSPPTIPPSSPISTPISFLKSRLYAWGVWYWALTEPHSFRDTVLLIPRDHSVLPFLYISGATLSRHLSLRLSLVSSTLEGAHSLRIESFACPVYSQCLTHRGKKTVIQSIPSHSGLAHSSFLQFHGKINYSSLSVKSVCRDYTVRCRVTPTVCSEPLVCFTRYQISTSAMWTCNHFNFCSTGKEMEMQRG